MTVPSYANSTGSIDYSNRSNSLEKSVDRKDPINLVDDGYSRLAYIKNLFAEPLARIERNEPLISSSEISVLENKAKKQNQKIHLKLQEEQQDEKMIEYLNLKLEGNESRLDTLEYLRTGTSHKMKEFIMSFFNNEHA